MASKLSSIFIMALVLILIIASSNARECIIVMQGNQKHQTGDGGTGCYGTDPSDPIHSAYCSEKPCCYTFYSNVGCTGSQIAYRCDTSDFPDAIKPSSVYLSCS
ncbi:hypothetical protein F8M41_010622 [Gigaspora margarita]|uniref:Uncharacterized protein n=1 Tax=Gigaspora margarita TaxID=4874 RepID=A0A8H4AUH5_GIGMA|nr:hypothetical protein F8M41_010622 [Gigaspora margarita]